MTDLQREYSRMYRQLAFLVVSWAVCLMVVGLAMLSPRTIWLAFALAVIAFCCRMKATLPPNDCGIRGNRHLLGWLKLRIWRASLMHWLLLKSIRPVVRVCMEIDRFNKRISRASV